MRFTAEDADAGRAASSARKQSLIDDYLNINGPHLTANAAAKRLGVSRRTVERYKTELRKRGLMPS